MNNINTIYNTGWINNTKFIDPRFPLILALTFSGDPIGWINYEKSADYIVKNKVLWSLGSHAVVLRGGTNSETGIQSMLSIDTIIAIKNSKMHKHHHDYNPIVTNKTLFQRDRNMCAYCGKVSVKSAQLTRDHILPKSKGGKNVWENIVTCCKQCNAKKGSKTLEVSHMELLYIPYVPSLHEHLILKNRNILADQMEYLLKGVPKYSRLLNS